MPKGGRALRSILSLDDLEEAARRRLPHLVYAYVSGTVETGASLRGNRAAFDAWGFRPRVLVDVSKRSQQVELFGRTYDAPFGIAPMGGTALCSYRGEIAFARAAGAANQIYLVSGAATIPMEEIRSEGPTTWFQAYMVSDRQRIEALAERIGRAGYEVVVVTVDVPVSSVKESWIRAGYSAPIRVTPRVVRDCLTHPRWLFGTALYTLFKSGMPHHVNYDAVQSHPLVSHREHGFRDRRDALTWDDLAFFRRAWKGKLLIKGILTPDDARRAMDIGVDGVIVSNHGGRQLDGAIAPLRVLPEIVEAVRNLPVLLDSGVRRGTDVLKALALGARYVFIGRPFNYALAVGGEAAVRHALKLLRDEIDRNLAMLGCRDLMSLDASFLSVEETHSGGRRPT